MFLKIHNDSNDVLALNTAFIVKIEKWFNNNKRALITMQSTERIISKESYEELVEKL